MYSLPACRDLNAEQYIVKRQAHSLHYTALGPAALLLAEQRLIAVAFALQEAWVQCKKQGGAPHEELVLRVIAAAARSFPDSTATVLCADLLQVRKLARTSEQDLSGLSFFCWHLISHTSMLSSLQDLILTSRPSTRINQGSTLHVVLMQALQGFNLTPTAAAARIAALTQLTSDDRGMREWTQGVMSSAEGVLSGAVGLGGAEGGSFSQGPSSTGGAVTGLGSERTAAALFTVGEVHLS